MVIIPQSTVDITAASAAAMRMAATMAGSLPKITRRKALEPWAPY